MTMHLTSLYRDPRIQEFALSKLTPMDLHLDERWKTRDLPRVAEQGLWYPIMLYKVTPDWWHGPFSRWRPRGCYYVDPVVNEDGMIWAIKMGSNRYQCACHLGYTSIDAIMFDHSDDCVKLGAWFRDCDPLNNSNARPYQGLYAYDDL
jgi:hypothetical protein